MNRSILGSKGLNLTDDEFACVLAALGQEVVPDLTSKPDATLQLSLEYPKDSDIYGPVVLWSNIRFIERMGENLENVDMRSLANAWQSAIQSLDPQSPRIRIIDSGYIDLPVSRGSISATPYPAIAEILRHPSVSARCVTVEVNIPFTDVRWEWPMRMTILRYPFPQKVCTYLHKNWPASKLLKCFPVSREQAHGEILVIAGPAREALLDSLSLQYDLHTGLIIIIGPFDEEWRSVTSLLDALVTQTKAGGVVLWQPARPKTIASQINMLVDSLSHSTPLELALAYAMGEDQYHALLSTELMCAVTIPVVAKHIAKRLLELPVPSAFSEPPDARMRMGLPELDVADLEGEEADIYENELLSYEIENNLNNLEMGAESASATGLSDIQGAEHQHRSKYAGNQAARFIQAKVLRINEQGELVIEDTCLAVGVPYLLKVRIGSGGVKFLTAPVPFPDEALDWDRDYYRLQVIFTESEQFKQPLQTTLDLYRTGNSDFVELAFTPGKAGLFRGRIILAYHGRVLQTAILSGKVLAVNQQPAVNRRLKLNLDIEARVRSSWADLEDRRPFDMALVVNRTSTGKPAMTAIGRRSAFVQSLDGVSKQVSRINQRLTDVAMNAKSYSTGLRSAKNVALLRDLAIHGAWLFRSLVKDQLEQTSTSNDLLTSEYLQIISTKPDALIPLEFIYDYPAPAKDAKLCENAEKALLDGKCSGCQPQSSPASVVCPLGFWGLRKVIERHVYDLNLAAKEGALAYVTAEPHRDRNKLLLKGTSMFAASKEVPAVTRKNVFKTLTNVWKKSSIDLKGWQDWKGAVSKATPSLVMVLPHNSGVDENIGLEISGDVLESIYICNEYVRQKPKDPAPIVCLLGCDTANTIKPDTYASHVSVFRQAEAAMVLSTVATVFGKHAGKVAEFLIQEFDIEAGRKTPAQFGEIIRNIKRRALLESLPMALCLVAFGDADWRLAKK